MAESNSSAELADTEPKLAQVIPSVEYRHVPLPLTAVTAMPFSAPLSTSAQPAPVRMVLTVVPDEAVSSSVPVRLTVAALVIVGASLIGFTVMLTVLTAEDDAPSNA